MNQNTFFEVTLFDPDHNLIAMFVKAEIEFRKVPVERKLVVALDETIKVANISNVNCCIFFQFDSWVIESRT
jgi:hypothetical protein